MKIRIWMILFSILCIQHTFAQSRKKIIKVGVVNIQEIMNVVSSDRVMRTLLENKQTEYLQKAEVLAREVKKLKEIRDKESRTLPAQRIDAINQDIIAKEEQLKELLDDKSRLLRQTESALSQKLYKEIYSIIKEVATTQGYSMILEKRRAVVYVEKELDITDDVLDTLKKEKEKIKTQ